MKRNSKWMFVAVVFLVMVAIILPNGVETAQERTAQNDMIETVVQVDEALDNLGYEKKGAIVEKLTPTTYTDPDGHTITFWYYHYVPVDEMEVEIIPTIYTEVFDPASAESSYDCVVGNLSGTIYLKNGRKYLYWCPSETTILLLDYDPNYIEEWKILKMAESCE